MFMVFVKSHFGQSRICTERQGEREVKFHVCGVAFVWMRVLFVRLWRLMVGCPKAVQSVLVSETAS